MGSYDLLGTSLVFRCTTFVAGVAFTGASILCVSCRGASIVDELHKENLGFVELGPAGRMRILDPLVPFFETRKLRDSGILIGVSRAGDQLLLLAQSHRTPETQYEQQIYDEIEITKLQEKVEAKVLPAVYRMLPFYAELSPDGHSIAFVGQFTTRDKTRADYGLHLLKISGDISTLVPTTEAETPQSIGWSMDGHTIVYDQSGRVLLYQLTSRTSSVLTDGSRPVWSPDGQWIAYRRPDGGAALIHPDGTGRRNILDGVKLGWGLRWSPDSRYLLYTDSSAFGSFRILEVATGRTANIEIPFAYVETQLRWVRGMRP